jgi:hypothetical protein
MVWRYNPEDTTYEIAEYYYRNGVRGWDIMQSNIKEGDTATFYNFKKLHKSEARPYFGGVYTYKNDIKIYETIRGNGGWDDWSMIEIEKYPCTDNNEARTRERYWFEKLNSTLNTYRPSSTKEEKQIYNKNKCYEYRQQNREKLLDEKKEYWEKNKDVLIEKHTIYREQNRTKINNQKKEHYEKNKDEINRIRREKYKSKVSINIST